MSEVRDPEVFRAVLDSLAMGVYITDRTGTILFWNQGAERITGHQRHEVIGHTRRENILTQCNEQAVPPVWREMPCFAMSELMAGSENCVWLCAIRMDIQSRCCFGFTRCAMRRVRFNTEPEVSTNHWAAGAAPRTGEPRCRGIVWMKPRGLPITGSSNFTCGKILPASSIPRAVRHHVRSGGPI